MMEQRPDLYQIGESKADLFSKADKLIHTYILKHPGLIGQLSIRQLSDRCNVSTAAVYRYVKKMEFSGYQEFQEWMESFHYVKETEPPSFMGHKELYLKAIMECVFNADLDKVVLFHYYMSRFPRVILLASEDCFQVAGYFYQLLITYGFQVNFPQEEFQVQGVIRRIRKEDVAIVLSMSGEDTKVIKYLRDLYSISTPGIISFTSYKKSTLKTMSDLSFPIFADEKSINGMDISSQCGMIAVFEILMYQLMTAQENKNPTISE